MSAGEAAATAPALPAVSMFWHGPALSRLERLCMTSFVAHGHSVRLHAYQTLSGVPAGVSIVDAAAVLPRSALDAHLQSRPIALFADRFRYELLHRYGGLWVDTDVVCLKPFAYAHPEVFGWQDENAINNAVLGLPAGHPLAEWMLRICEQPYRPHPYDNFKTRRRKLMAKWLGMTSKEQWGATGPQGFTRAAQHLGFANLALPFWHFYAIHYLNWRSVFDTSLAGNPTLLSASHGLHLWNEMARRAPGFDKNARFPDDSVFERLCRRYGA